MTPRRTIDRYELREVLGSGSMGRVYNAWDPKLHRQVALKLLSKELSKQPKARERFAREARAIAALRHPTIVEIYDYSGADSSFLYLVMEKLEGDDLFNVVDRRGPMPEPAAAAVGHELCLALEVAHGAGVIHRDLKPENVFVNASGRVVLTDFGIVKAVRENSAVSGHDHKTDVIGTPGFMAPEVMLNKALGPYTDIFALGALLYNITTGRLPYEGNGPMDVFKAVMSGTYDDPRKYNRLLSEPMCTLLAGMLQPKPRRRIQSVAQVRERLKSVLAACGVTDLRDDLREYMEDPAAYGRAAQRRAVVTLLQRIKIAVKDKDHTTAEALRRRLVRLDPGNQEVRAITGIARMPELTGSKSSRGSRTSGRRRRGRGTLLIAAAVVGAVVLTAAGYIVLHPKRLPRAAAALDLKQLVPEHHPRPVRPRAPAKAPGRLQLTVRSGAAIVWLDGNRLGRVGRRRVVTLDAGEHEIELRSRRMHLKRHIHVLPGATVAVVADLKRGRIAVDSSAPHH